MQLFTGLVSRAGVYFNYVAGAGLVVMMLATMADILMRTLGRPLVGAMEIVSFCGAVVIGLAIPHSSAKKVHISVDFLTDRLTTRGRARLRVVTRLMGIVLFLFASYNFVGYSLDLWRAKEVSGGLRLPYYPLTLGLALSCLLQALTLSCQLLETLGLVKND